MSIMWIHTSATAVFSTFLDSNALETSDITDFVMLSIQIIIFWASKGQGYSLLQKGCGCLWNQDPVLWVWLEFFSPLRGTKLKIH